MKVFASSWQFWAVLSATFAALTAVFAKIGVENVNSDFATFIRSIVIFFVLTVILTVTGNGRYLPQYQAEHTPFLSCQDVQPVPRGFVTFEPSR